MKEYMISFTEFNKDLGLEIKIWEKIFNIKTPKEAITEYAKNAITILSDFRKSEVNYIIYEREDNGQWQIPMVNKGTHFVNELS